MIIMIVAKNACSEDQNEEFWNQQSINEANVNGNNGYNMLHNHVEVKNIRDKNEEYETEEEEGITNKEEEEENKHVEDGDEDCLDSEDDDNEEHNE